MSGAISATSAALVGTAAAGGAAATAGLIGAGGAVTLGGAASAALAGFSLLQAVGTIGQGNAQRAALDNQAAQKRVIAGQDMASAERDQANKLRAGAYAESRAQAVIGASGADPNSVTATKDITDIEGQSEYGALTALFNGQSKAQGLNYDANLDLQRGEAAHDAGVIGGIGNAGSSLARAYMTPSTTGGGGKTMVDQYADQLAPSGINIGTYNMPWSG